MKFSEGAIVDVVVVSVEPYGVVVQFEGQNGILLETEIDWDYDGMHDKMFDMFQPGQTLRAKVMVVAPQQFSVSLKHLQPEKNPWRDPSTYAVGTKHDGVVRSRFEDGHGGLIKLQSGPTALVEYLPSTARVNDQLTIVVREVDVERESIRAEVFA